MEFGASTPMELLVAVALLVSAYTDLTAGRIRNAVTLPLWAVGVVYWLVVGLLGVDGASWWTGLLGLGLMLPIHFGFFAIGLDKAGDAKLMIGVGACLGWWVALESTILAILLMGPVALITLLVRGRLGSLGAHLRYLLVDPFKKAMGLATPDPPESLYIIKGVVLLVAVVLAWGTSWLDPLLLNETTRAWLP